MAARADAADVLDEPFVLPADATLVPLSELSPRVRATLGPVDDPDRQVAVSRPRFRVPTRLVTPELAALLAEFRQPSRIADAVLRFSRARERDPFETLENAFDALAVLINSRVLVPASSPGAEALVASLAPGEAVAGYEVERLVSALDDTEVFLARTEAGARVALKIARPDAAEAVASGLAAERRMLEHLAGASTPSLVDHGVHRGRPFLVQQWRDGVPITVAAQRARAAPDASARLRELCVGVLSAYSALHERGVVHGDIHPGNVIVGDDGTVTVVDFGRSRRVGADSPAQPARAGVAYFYEPEMAAALLAGGFPPPPTPLGEQYALAALLYFVVTGAHYVDFSPENDVLLRQVVARPPLPFTARGVAPWPALERALARALSKDPAERFPDVGELLSAVEQAEPATAPPHRVVGDATTGLVEQFARLAKQVLADGRSAAPAEHVDARDLAWFALRAALVREDADMLASADVWATRAATSGRPPDWGLEATTCGIHRARGDGAAHARSAVAFLSACERVGGNLELAGGRSGALVAAAGVLDGLRGTDADPGPLTRWVRQAIDEGWASVDTWPQIGECRELPHLGMAHGWAGVLYATLLGCRSTATAIPSGVPDRLRELAELAQPSGAGVRWPGTIPHPGIRARTPSLAPGWCSGSAGHAILWCLAWEQLSERRYLDLAVRAGRYAIDHPARSPDLCCGLTGRAFALLSLYRTTGETRWLVAARRLAHAAAGGWPSSEQSPSLRRGPLGTALLLVELEAPESAVFPVLGPLRRPEATAGATG